MLDATIQIMLEEGYAAATSRRVAALAGVNRPLVHYYFPTMDDLYLAVFRRGAAANLDRQQQALASDRPLTRSGRRSASRAARGLLLEFMGLATTARRSGRDLGVVGTLAGDADHRAEFQLCASRV
jgi:AcrR family transcriptional regulator